MSNKNLTNPTTEEMAREVYEAITGKCATFTVKAGIGDNHEYIKYEVKSLATSIDAWHEHIFPVMSDEQKREHAHALYHMDECEGMYTWEATPMHHLTAAYNVVKGE